MRERQPKTAGGKGEGVEEKKEGGEWRRCSCGENCRAGIVADWNWVGVAEAATMAGVVFAFHYNYISLLPPPPSLPLSLSLPLYLSLSPSLACIFRGQ